MTFQEQVLACMEYTKMKNKDVYEALEISKQAWRARINSGNFTLNQLQELAEIFGAEYIYHFKNKYGYKYRSVNYYDMIRKAVVGCGKTMTELAKSQGVSRQAVYDKTNRCRLSQEYLNKCAEFAGCKYESGFLFPDGTFIG